MGTERPELHNITASGIRHFHLDCHVQFRHQTPEGPQVVHGVLGDYSIGQKTVLLTLKYSTGEERDFVLSPNEGVTFIVNRATEDQAPGTD